MRGIRKNLKKSEEFWKELLRRGKTLTNEEAEDIMKIIDKSRKEIRILDKT